MKRWIRGSCHCQQVRFEVEVGEALTVYRCNCSICRLTGFLHLIVPRSEFHLHTPETQLSEYRFNSGVAHHWFCRRCGIKSFYLPRSHPEGISVNFRCLDIPADLQVRIEDFDGQNWEASAASLNGLS